MSHDDAETVRRPEGHGPAHDARLSAARWYEPGRREVSHAYDARAAPIFSLAVVDVLARTLPEEPAVLVELGCGPGRALAAAGRRFPRAHLLGLDPDPDAVHAAAQVIGRRGVALPRCAEDLRAVLDEQDVPGVDAAVVTLTVALWSDPDISLLTAASALNPGGVMVVLDLLSPDSDAEEESWSQLGRTPEERAYLADQARAWLPLGRFSAIRDRLAELGFSAQLRVGPVSQVTACCTWPLQSASPDPNPIDDHGPDAASAVLLVVQRPQECPTLENMVEEDATASTLSPRIPQDDTARTRVVDPRVSSGRLPGGDLDNMLSPRECQVLQGASDGQTNRCLARALGVREATVKTYWQRIFTKLGIRDRTAAVARAMALRLITGPLPFALAPGHGPRVPPSREQTLAATGSRRPPSRETWSERP